MKIFGFAGYSGSGKTTLIEQLIPQFTAKGLRVSLIKHTHHDFDLDQPGKDSWRHRQAGAQEVLLAGGRRWALLHELRDDKQPSLMELCQHLAECDLLLVEGYKYEAIPKLEIHRPALSKPLLQPDDLNIVAIASDHPLNTPLPNLDLNQPAQIATFILDHLHL